MARFELHQYHDALTRYFASLREVALAYLYGSQARNCAWAESDVDIAVLLAGRPDADECFTKRLAITGDLMDLLATDDVDVQILNQAPSPLCYAVLRDGILLFQRNQRMAAEFQLRTVNEYLDFYPILKRHERAFLEKARRGELCGGQHADQRPAQPDPEVLGRFTRLPADDL